MYSTLQKRLSIIPALMTKSKLLYTYRYSNGDGFMSDVADAISKAKKEIYITDWM